MNELIKISLFLCLLQFPKLMAQDLLTLENALSIGIKNNFNVQMVNQNAEILKQEATPGAAGMLPTVALSANIGQAHNAINQKFSTGLEVNRTGVQTANLNSNIGLNWTIFDGFKMFVTLDKLKEIYAQGQIAVRLQMEQVALEIITRYCTVAKEQQQLQNIENQIAIVEERLKIAKTRLEIGNGNKTDVLQAQVDLNEQKVAKIKQLDAIYLSKNGLNLITGNTLPENYTVENNIPTVLKPKLADLATEMAQNNSRINLAEKNVLLSAFTLKETKSALYPKLGLNVNYNFNASKSNAGFALLNQSTGLNYGLNFNWTIFNGTNTKQAIKVAQYNQLIYRLQFTQAQQEQKSKLETAMNQLNTTMELIELEKESIQFAEENVTIMLERFKLAQCTTLELKDAQKSLLDAKSRLVIATYDAQVKLAEIKMISGSLI